MGRYSKKKNMSKEAYEILTVMFNRGFGRSRHEDKKTGFDKKCIYSKNTYKTYRREVKHFLSWCRGKHDCKTLKECRQYAPEWLKEISETKSAWTAYTKAAAIAKLYGESINDFGIEMPGRTRAGIKRSRDKVEYDRHISKEKAEEFGGFTRCVGCRIREMKALKGTDLIERDGKYFVSIRNGKGGRRREALVIGSEAEIRAVVRKFRDAGENRVFASIPRALDNHSYRAEYATRLYHMLERDIDSVPSEERYYCRKDMKGVVLDKKAMGIVSKYMGHSRINVIAESYLRY